MHGQEFVFNAAATKRWGIPLLEAMQAATVGSIATSSSLSPLAGGSAASASGDAGNLVQVNVDTGGQSAQTSQRQGPGGTSIIDVVIGKVADNIAGGGKVGQTIQSTFGITRKGQVRG